jgi:tetratricopeptide (TPR) repeat protein
MISESGSSGTPPDLRMKFPDLKPVNSPPALFRLNGFGVGMYGRRDFDPETGTYLKTRCLCLLFVPVMAVDTWRVADAETGGWYFLGKEPPSFFARAWRLTVLLLFAAMIGKGAWTAHTESEAYQVARAGKEAASLIEEGKPLEAAGRFTDMIDAGLGEEAAWRAKLVAVLETELASPDAARVAAAVAFADRNQEVGGHYADPLVPDLADRALKAAASCGDPAAAHKILEAFDPEAGDFARVEAARRGLLEKRHEAEPSNTEVAVKLALSRERVGEVEGALELLAPAAGELGSGEGARLYGMLLSGEGRPVEALPFLEAYVEPRKADWTQAEDRFQRAYEVAQQRALDRLNRDQGPPGFRARYEAAPETEQMRMVDEYLAGQLGRDPAFVKARDRYQESAELVPVIMELGVTRLRIAQAESDPDRRGELLEQAEQAFLSLKTVAGESDEYRMFLGQVYYWSGRAEEGRKLFDEVIEANGRDAATLYGVASLLRDLGIDHEARNLLEEAFGKATGPERDGVVQLRALLATSDDDKVAWLEKGDPQNASIRIGLAEARGLRAEEEGRLDEAAKHFREALDGYEKQGKTPAALNNSSLIYRYLYRLDGNRDHLDRAARLLSEAVALSPNDSILSLNAAESNLMAAVLRIVGDRIDPAIVQFDPDAELLRFLYADEEGRRTVREALAADPNFRQALKHSRDALLLAPGNPGSYGIRASLCQWVRDEAGMEELAAKAREQSFDHSAGRAEREKFLNGVNDARIRQAIGVRKQRLAELVEGLDHGKARAMAAAHVGTVHLSGFALGEDPAFDEWFDGLVEAQRTAPCSRLHAALMSALKVKAVEELAKSDPGIARIVGSARRHLDAEAIFCLLVRASGEIGERTRAHPVAVAARREQLASLGRFPSSPSLIDWLLVDGLGDGVPAGFREAIDANRLDWQGREMAMRLADPESPAAICVELLNHLYRGDPAKVGKCCALLRDAGLVLPDFD